MDTMEGMYLCSSVSIFHSEAIIDMRQMHITQQSKANAIPVFVSHKGYNISIERTEG